MIESTREHLKKSFLFKESLTVPFILQHFLRNQYSMPLQTLELQGLSGLSPFSRAFATIKISLNREHFNS